MKRFYATIVSLCSYFFIFVKRQEERSEFFMYKLLLLLINTSRIIGLWITSRSEINKNDINFLL